MRGRIYTLQAASSPSLGKVAPSPRPDNPRSSPQTPDAHQQPQGSAEARRVARDPCAHCCHTRDVMALETASVQRAGAQASKGRRLPLPSWSCCRWGLPPSCSSHWRTIAIPVDCACDTINSTSTTSPPRVPWPLPRSAVSGTPGGLGVHRVHIRPVHGPRLTGAAGSVGAVAKLAGSAPVSVPRNATISPISVSGSWYQDTFARVPSNLSFT